MNKVLLTGRIANDLKLRETKNGTKVCDFTMAIPRGFSQSKKQDTDFISCITYGVGAEALCNYQKKGSLIAIFGELRVDSYEVNGEKKYKNYVLVSNMEFLDKKAIDDKIDKEKKEFEEASIKTEFHDQLEITEDDYPF